jgi:hypothetical protein
MAQQKRQGDCCICGHHGVLSYEHVPPRSAFNKTSAVAYKWNDILTESKNKGRTLQGGLGAYTLCEQCNNATGSWYGDEYVKWARTGYLIWMKWRQAHISSGTVRLFNVYPLRFLKQVTACFFSLIGEKGGATFARSYPELAKFVLDKYSTNLPANFRFFLNLYDLRPDYTALRREALAARVNGFNADMFSEIAHPPFQLLMTSDGTAFPDAADITGFAQYQYDQVVDQDLTMRIVNSASHMPGSG